MSGVLTAASLLLAVGCGAGSSVDTSPAGASVPYETVLSQAYSGLDEALSEVVQDQGTWTALWDRIHSRVEPRPPLPPVDFSRHMLIAVATGARSSGGFGVAVREVAVHEDELVVEVLETCPARGSMVTLALTQPVAVVRLEKLSQTPVFHHVKSPSCD
jgi:hypothetical protein